MQPLIIGTSGKGGCYGNHPTKGHLGLNKFGFLIMILVIITVFYLLCFSELFPKTEHWYNILNINLNINHSTPYALTFKDSNQLPFFYKPPLTHPNDVYREKFSISVKSFLKQDLTKSKLIVFFNMPGWIKEYYLPYYTAGAQKCPITSCELSENPEYLSKADAVVVDGVQLHEPNPPVKHPNQVWIFYGIEPMTEYSPRSTCTFRSGKWISMFNWTMTYRLDSDVVAPYDVLVHNNVKSNKNFTDVALAKTKSTLWLVSHCTTQSKREEYVRKLNKNHHVDIYGECGPTKSRYESDDTLYKEYRFYLAFENVFCDDYVTEKLFKLYTRDVHVIPIVRGGAKYQSLFPKGTYINAADFSSPKKLAEYLNRLEKNVTAYAEMLSEKDKYVMTGDLGKLVSPFCDVCIKLHNLDVFSNHYPDVSKWLEEGVRLYVAHLPTTNANRLQR